MSQEKVGAAIKQSVASLIVDLAGEVECIAEETAKRTMNKLQGVMSSPPPTSDEKCKEATINQEYPELFEVLRAKLQGIKVSLATINDGLDRTEL